MKYARPDPETNQRYDQWPLGANNVAAPNRLPEGFVREMHNLVPHADGMPRLRPGYDRLVECADCRFAAVVGSKVVFVDGVDVYALDTATSEVQLLGQLYSAAPVTGAVLAGRLYLCSATDSVRTDGQTLRQWAVPTPAADVEVIDGHLPAGLYRFAVTAMGDDGEESAAQMITVQLAEGKAVRLTSDDPRLLRVYTSVVNGEALYYQQLLVGGASAVTAVRDDTETLTTYDLAPFPTCDELKAHHGVLVGRLGRYVMFTSPMYPHLVDPVAGFFQYGAPVTLVAPTDGGVYIAADKTYFITGLETAEPVQRVVSEVGAVEGSATALPDGSVAWFTKYGQAIGSPSGQIALPMQRNYAPDIAARGAAGVVEHDGVQMVVTSMRGAVDRNNLATGDFADLEVGP